MANLVEIIEGLDDVESKLASYLDAGEEPPADLVTKLTDMIGLQDDKVDAVGRIVTRFKLAEAMCKELSKSMSERAERFARRRYRLESYVMAVMQAHGRRKIESKTVTMTILSGRPRVVIDNEEYFVHSAPDVYVRRIPERLEPNREAVRKALEEGVEVENARLENGEPRLRVYV